MAEIRATRASPAIRATTEPRQTLLPERSAGGCSHRVIGNEPAEGPAHSIPRHVVARRVAGATSRRRPALTTAHHPCRSAARPGADEAAPHDAGSVISGLPGSMRAPTATARRPSAGSKTAEPSRSCSARLTGGLGSRRKRPIGDSPGPTGSLGRRHAPRNPGFGAGSVTGQVFAAEAGTLTGQRG